jgi:hypothetical protein
MHPHMSLRERLEALAGSAEPTFEASADPTLVAFGRLFTDSGLFSFDANKHLRTDALSPIYDCWTESRTDVAADPQRFIATWDPVWAGTDPVTGFRTGQDSALLGSTPTVAMPPDERTAALLLLVTTPFVHLSASGAGDTLVVEGAVDADDGRYRFLTLVASLVADHAERLT